MEVSALDKLIERRSRHNPDRPAEASWAGSVRAYNSAKDAANRAAWADYHAEQAERLRRTLEPLIAFHEARAQALLENETKGAE